MIVPEDEEGKVYVVARHKFSWMGDVGTVFAYEATNWHKFLAKRV